MTRSMKGGRRSLLAVVALGAPWCLAALSPASRGLRPWEERRAQERRVERGEYLVRHVAMCVQCHTPRDDEGNLIEERLLQGAGIPVESPFPEHPWAFHAPSLAGLPGGWSEEELVLFLETGRSKGEEPSPPMPPFRMQAEDARAVAAYLRSLE